MHAFALTALLIAATLPALAQAPTDAYAYAERRKPLMARQEQTLEDHTRGNVPAPTAATLRLEAQPDAVAVTYTLPAAEGAARLELTDVRTGRVLFAGQVLAPGGAVTLPVPGVVAECEARLITAQAAIAGRLRR